MRNSILFALINFLFIVIMTSCSTTQKPINLSFSEFTIGSGGGATGLFSGFTIDSTCKLYQWNGRKLKDNMSELKTLKADTAILIEDIIIKSNLIDFNFEKPDNFYRFFQIKTTKKENYIVWGLASDTDNTNNLNEIYDKIMSIINNNK